MQVNSRPVVEWRLVVKTKGEREREREIRTYGIARGLTRDTDYEVIVTSLACHLSVHRSARTEQPLPVHYRGKYRGHGLQRCSPPVK